METFGISRRSALCNPGPAIATTSGCGLAGAAGVAALKLDANKIAVISQRSAGFMAFFFSGRLKASHVRGVSPQSLSIPSSNLLVVNDTEATPGNVRGTLH